MAGYSVTFEVVDKASRKIDEINRNLKRSMAPVERLSKSTQQFARLTGLQKISDGFGAIARTATSAFTSVMRVLPGIGALTSAATIAGMAGLAKSTADWGKALRETANRAGVSAQDLEKYENAAKLAGIATGEMDAALTGLQSSIAGFIRGDNAEAIGWFRKLGIEVRDANGHYKTAAELLPEVTRKIQDIKDPSDRARASQALLGDATGHFVTALKESGGTIDEWLGKADKFGTKTQEQLDALRGFSQAWAETQANFEHFGQTIGIQIATAFTPLLSQLNKWFDANRAIIDQKISDVITKIADAIASVDWDKFFAGVKQTFDQVASLVASLGGIKDILHDLEIAFEVVFAVKAVSAVTSLIKVLGSAGVGGLGGIGLLGGLAAVKVFLDYMDSKAHPERWAVSAASPAEQAEWERTHAGAWTGPSISGANVVPNVAGGVSGSPDITAMNLPADQTGRMAGVRDRLMHDLGISSNAAAGIVGNLMQESHLQATQEQGVAPGTGGFGWAQWTGSRRRQFEAYAATHGGVTSDEANYGFLTQELQSPEYAGVLARLRRGDITAREASDIVEQGYERPGTPMTDRRRAFSAAAASAGAPPVAFNNFDAGSQGAPVATAAPPRPVNGSVAVTITQRTPPDTRVSATATGDVDQPRIERASMAGP